MKPTDRWKQLLDDRLHEAITLLGGVPGVSGFIVGGSTAGAEPWPMSDIDLIPIYGELGGLRRGELSAGGRAELVDWWAASGRARNARRRLVRLYRRGGSRGYGSVGLPPCVASGLLTDRRWFHGLDKAYGGHTANPDHELGKAFSDWITATRFHPTVVAARIGLWHQQAIDTLDEATRAEHDDPVKATFLLRESARGLRMVLIERWGERLGSMGREWTRFERMAQRHGQRPLAARIAALAGADAQTAGHRASIAPSWLQERIDLCYAARIAIGENVTWAENARDQLAAFAVHVARHRPDLNGPWTANPDPDLSSHLAELHDLVDQQR